MYDSMIVYDYGTIFSHHFNMHVVHVPISIRIESNQERLFRVPFRLQSRYHYRYKYDIKGTSNSVVEDR